MTGDGQGHVGISEWPLKVVLAERSHPVRTQSMARMTGTRRGHRAHLRHVLPHQLGTCASPITHGALTRGRDRAFRSPGQAQPMGQPARIDLSMAQRESRRRLDGRRMGEVHAIARLAKAIDEPIPGVRGFDHQARELRVIRSQGGQDGREIVGHPCFSAHVIMGIKQRHETVVRLYINATLECHGRPPQLRDSSGCSGFPHPDCTA
jgi:hypothetical protein